MPIARKVLFTFLLLTAFFIVGLSSIIIYDTQSKVSEIKNYKQQIALRILDRKDRLIANVFEDKFRYFASFDEIPPRIIETLLAVEDTMFFEHNGVNFDAISRAMLKNIKSGGYIEGGSTITQQLVKNIVLSNEKTIDRKIKEAILAIQVENVLTKEEILEKYINYIYFGHGYYGVKTAAHGYFNKDLQSLTLKETAMLMALPRAPSYYDPIKNFEFSISRANSILERMHSIGWINKDEYQVAINERPKIYNRTLSQNLAPYVVDEVLRQLSNIKDIKTGGYIVKTNIDLDYQAVAQKSLVYGYNNIQKRLKSRNAKKEIPEGEIDTLNGAIVVTENGSGNILALVGGVDYAKSNFNRATQSQRQFGSTIKPFIYQIAFDMGYSPASSISDTAKSFGELTKNNGEESSENLEIINGNNNQNLETTQETLTQNQNEIIGEIAEEDTRWRPRNFNESFNGLVSLKEALQYSLNLATINLVDLVGFYNVYNKMTDYGFKNLQKDMSIILGSVTLSPLEAARHYSLFSNYGTINEPKLIKSVLDINGDEKYVIEDNPIEMTTKDQAFLTIDSLKNIVENGTGKRAKLNGIELAGKTGTSNKNIDAWFSGFSPTLQVVIWYGRDDNTPIGEYESGGVISAPVFSHFFSNILKFEPGLKRSFDVPEGVWRQNVNGKNYYYTTKSKIPKQITNSLNENLIF